MTGTGRNTGSIAGRLAPGACWGQGGTLAALLSAGVEDPNRPHSPWCMMGTGRNPSPWCMLGTGRNSGSIAECRGRGSQQLHSPWCIVGTGRNTGSIAECRGRGSQQAA
eukprot:TRINITY_DN1370_c0_g2_i1.p2 TRINITY_DN1370_c0_g2~~TRINITY_DN1370_c0_g2_i1.p2  ORF type:complete len:109 (+),score=3.31 TRINITY_DN1370_c0_g2_i1:140-466(+)